TDSSDDLRDYRTRGTMAHADVPWFGLRYGGAVLGFGRRRDRSSFLYGLACLGGTSRSAWLPIWREPTALPSGNEDFNLVATPSRRSASDPNRLRKVGIALAPTVHSVDVDRK